jgi:hypothetical protein
MIAAHNGNNSIESFAFLASAEPPHHHLEDKETTRINRHTSHHAYCITTEEGTNAVSSSLVYAVKHTRILALLQIVYLDKSFHVIYWIDNTPICYSSSSSSQ